MNPVWKGTKYGHIAGGALHVSANVASAAQWCLRLLAFRVLNQDLPKFE
jgi:hypothetical protein